MRHNLVLHLFFQERGYNSRNLRNFNVPVVLQSKILPIGFNTRQAEMFTMAN